MDPIIASITVGFSALKLGLQTALAAFLGATLGVQIAVGLGAVLLAIGLCTAIGVGLYKLFHRKKPEVVTQAPEASIKDPIEPTTEENKDVTLNDFECPISLELMENPVIAQDGYIYDEASLLDYATKSVEEQKKYALMNNQGHIEPSSIVSPKNTEAVLKLPLILRPSEKRKQQIDAYRALLALKPSTEQEAQFFELINSQNFKKLKSEDAELELQSFLSTVSAAQSHEIPPASAPPTTIAAPSTPTSPVVVHIPSAFDGNELEPFGTPSASSSDASATAPASVPLAENPEANNANGTPADNDNSPKGSSSARRSSS